MSDLLRLRDYQEECLDAITVALTTVKRPAIVLPTGAGKTVVFGHEAARFLEQHPEERVLVLAHTDELTSQAMKKIKSIAPHLPVGLVKAERNEVHARVVVASVQSLRNRKRRSQIKRVGLILVDECHHATAPTYRSILKHYGALEPELGEEQDYPAYRTGEGAQAVGFTATLARGDNAKLSEVWQDVAFRRDIAFMIRRRYLLDVRGKRVQVPDFTTKGLKIQGGDFQATDLADRLVDSMAPEKVAQAYVEHASDRAGLVFTPNVASAYVFAEAFNAEGVSAEVVHGALPTEERRLIIKRLESGDLQVVVNCMVLTEGFDSPIVSCVVIARPTKSGPLYQQMVGRALRLYSPPGHVAEDAPAWVRTPQTQALVLDVVGASRQHGLASLIDLSEREVPEDVDPEDFSLIELEDFLDRPMEDEPGVQEPVDYYTGPVEVQDFDPLQRDSKRAWKTTASGVHYLPMGTAKTGGLYMFLVPAWGPEDEPGTWSVCWCTQSGRPADLPGFPARAVGATEHQGIPLSQAMVWAEQVVEDLAIRQGLDPAETFSRKAAPWRRKPGPSDKQAELCRRLRIQLPTGPTEADPFQSPVRLTQGEVSDLIDNVLAAQQVDRWVAFLDQQRSK